MNFRAIMIVFCLQLLGVTWTYAEKPKEAADRIWQSWKSSPTDAEVLKLAKKTADDQGVAIIDPIMARSKEWKGEEVLIFVPVIVALPPQKSVPILKSYFEKGKSWEKSCANDLLIEINTYIQEHKSMSESDRKKLFEGWHS